MEIMNCSKRINEADVSANDISETARGDFCLLADRRTFMRRPGGGFFPLDIQQASSLSGQWNIVDCPARILV